MNWAQLAEQVPYAPGIYCLWVNGQPYYIGTSHCMRQRLRSHTLRDSAEIIERITWIETPKENGTLCDFRFARLSMERWLIRKHNPPRNLNKPTPFQSAQVVQ